MGKGRVLALALAGVAGFGCIASGPGAPLTAEQPTSAVERSSSSSPTHPTVPEGWLGGLREVDIDAPPSVVMAVLSEPEAYRRTLPFVRSLDVVGRGPQGDAIVTIVDGTKVMNAVFTLHLLREREDRVTFWLDETFPHDIDAARGFGQVAPREGGGSRLTWFIAFDMSGATRLFFGGNIQRAAMTTPDRIRALAEERAQTPERNALR